MNIGDLRRILVAFADDATDLDLADGQLIVQIREEILQVAVNTVDGELYVREDGGEQMSAFRWIVQRVARIPLLARRVEDNVVEELHFVTPSGKVLDRLDADPTDHEKTIVNVPETALNLLSSRPAGTSTVLYLTSDAGEGKTTIINWMAREQARRYMKKKSPWLLLPISLAGRSFMTFDDIVVAELVNKMRFQLFYYEAFLELVKLGVLVPAFDGFEEMFVEGSSGEALSALGNLMNDLDSSGTVLIAARKAYFEYQNFASQAKFFENIRNISVSFARIGINRWKKSQFLEYADRRGMQHGDAVYAKIKDRFGLHHPLLTRAVLVKRLVDTAIDGNIDVVIENLSGTEPKDYFFQFVNTLIEREAGQKWVDRSGTPYQPLLTVKEHHSLLASIAQEMWISSSEVLRGEHLNVIAELFAANLNKPSEKLRQIVERIRQHALISRVSGKEDAYTFDHEDFRRFYLGEALGETLMSGSLREIEKFIERASLPPETCDAALQVIIRERGDLHAVFRSLQRLVDSATPTSYAIENSGAIGIQLLESLRFGTGVTARGFSFPTDALKGRRLDRIKFRACHFQNTSLEGTELTKCEFAGCTMYHLDIPENFDAGDSQLNETEVLVIARLGESTTIYDPAEIGAELSSAGFDVIEKDKHRVSQHSSLEPDEDTLLAERGLRAFMRSTQINEGVFRQKFGKDANHFMRNVLPKMIDRGVLQEVPYKGGGPVQSRFGIKVPMSNLEAAIPVRVSSLEDFLSTVLEGE